MPAGADLERVAVESRAEWRRWLEDNHEQARSVWVVTWKKQSGGPHVPLSDIVDEALCFGWIDSLPRKLDDGRSMLLLSPRRAGSNWSRVNREKVARLTAEGLMASPGLAAVARAKVDGTWTALDRVEALEIPADLAAALAAEPPAADTFQGFSPSARRGILEWLSTARTPATRARRVAEIAAYARLGLKAVFPKDRSRFKALSDAGAITPPSGGADRR